MKQEISKFSIVLPNTLQCVMDVKLEKSWKKLLADEFDKPYFQKLAKTITAEYKTKTIFPPGPHIFRALDLTPVDKVKVVIIGQDPYHTPGAAMGLAFSVPEAHGRLQPSLQNIFKELSSDLGSPPRTNPDLTDWAKQGVLLLNATLTVRQGEAGSHQGLGWEEFTDSVIKNLNQEKEGLIFILWGKYAQNKGKVIDESKHLVIKSPHPSPFSANRGFFGSQPFSKANQYLEKHGEKAVNW